jgi:hypothetical protein
VTLMRDGDGEESLNVDHGGASCLLSSSLRGVAASPKGARPHQPQTHPSNPHGRKWREVARIMWVRMQSISSI